MAAADAVLSATIDAHARPFFARVQAHLRAVRGGGGAGPVDDSIRQLLAGATLSDAQATAAFEQLIGDTPADEQVGAFLVLLRPEVLGPDAIAAFARVMRDRSRPVRPRLRSDEALVDTCGTGSDGLGTYNVSTTIAFILAAAGLRVAKHGNRAITGRCGSADVLEALGARIDLPPAAVERCIEQVGVGFMLAPAYHPAFGRVQRVRRLLSAETPASLQARTVFNVLGPLANPACAPRQVIGVYDGALLERLGAALVRLGTEHALLVHGAPGLDELSTAGPTQVAEVRDGRVTTWTLLPEDAGLPRVADATVFAGGDATENARIVRAVLGAEDTGPRLDLALLNAAAGLVVGGRVATLADGVTLAREVIRSGEPLRRLDAFCACTLQ